MPYCGHCTSQGSIIPNEPGKKSPDERSWNARLTQNRNNK